jgi:hypothetical protein
MMTHLFKFALKIARPIFVAMTILLSGPIFAILDQVPQGAQTLIVATESPQLSAPSRTTVIYKNSFFGT